jgi:hypothetical protein
MLSPNQTQQSNGVWSLEEWELIERRMRVRALAETSEQAAWNIISRQARAVMRAYTTSFFIVSRFLPAVKRTEVEVVYAAVRYPDEIVDTFPLERAEQLRRLDEWSEGYEAGLAAVQFTTRCETACRAFWRVLRKSSASAASRRSTIAPFSLRCAAMLSRARSRRSRI